MISLSLRSFIFIVIFWISHFNTLAVEVNGRIELLDSEKNWQEGEVKRIQVTIWPVSEVSFDDLRQELEGKDFAEIFLLGKISTIEFSENNPEALIFKADSTLKKARDSKLPIIFSFRALNIPMDISNLNLIQGGEVPAEFYTLDANDLEDERWFYIALFMIIALLVATFGYVAFSRRNKTKPQDEVDWKKVLLLAEDRKDYESIYRQRERMLIFFGGTNPSFERLFEIINKHQYKKEWNDDVLHELSFVMDEIKESLSD